MTDLILKVEVVPGSDIEGAIRSALILAGNLGLLVEFNFNGVVMLVKHDGNNGNVLDKRVEHYYNEWLIQMKSK